MFRPLNMTREVGNGLTRTLSSNKMERNKTKQNNGNKKREENTQDVNKLVHSMSKINSYLSKGKKTAGKWNVLSLFSLLLLPLLCDVRFC